MTAPYEKVLVHACSADSAQPRPVLVHVCSADSAQPRPDQMYWCTCVSLNQHNQEKRAMSPDPFPFYGWGLGMRLHECRRVFVGAPVLLLLGNVCKYVQYLG